MSDGFRKESGVEADELLACLATAVDAILAVVDEEAQLLASSTEGVGLPREAALGSSVYDLLPPHAHDAFRRAHRKAFAEGRSARCEVQGPSGRWYSCRLLPLPGSVGTSRRALVLARDSTEERVAAERERRLEERLVRAQANEALTLLAGGVAHDFNNLLVGIQGNIELSLRRLGNESPATPLLEAAHEATRRAAELVDRLLTYAGRRSPRRAPLRLDVLAREMLDLLRSGVCKKADLRLDLDAALPPLEADATQLRQAIANLVINAAEALGGQPGTVWVRAGLAAPSELAAEETLSARPGSALAYVVLEVEDTGPGVPADARRRVFDPFYSTKGSRRGLGLATVDGIARGHGGALALRSPPGRGAAFRLYLPCADPGSEELPLEPLPDAPLPRLSGRALLLDDDPFVRAVLRALLRTCGAELAIADRAPEALGLLARGDFALVLLDPALPERAGPALFAELRRRAPELPVVLLCGHGEEPARRTWPGCVAYVRKPFRLRDLLSALAPLLGDRSPPTDSAAAP